MGKYIKNTRGIIGQGNIVYDDEKIKNPDSLPNLYFGNGRFGGCVDYFGRANNIVDGTGRMVDKNSGTRSYFSHKHHCEVGCQGIECRLPLFLQDIIIYWNDEPLTSSQITVSNYSQTLDIYTALITTEYTISQETKKIVDIRIEQYISMAETAQMHLSIKAKPYVEGLKIMHSIELLSHCISHHGVPIDYVVDEIECMGYLALKSETSRSTVSVAMITNKNEAVCLKDDTLSCIFEITEERTFKTALIVVCNRGDLSLEEAINELCCVSEDEHRKKHIDAWEKFWNTSMISLQNSGHLMEIWLRSLYYLRSSESTEPSIPLTSGGLASTGLWPMCFPQDYLWIYESYFLVNHMELTKSTSRFWLNILEQAREYTKKYLKTDGVFFPWMPSNFDLSDMEKPPIDPPFSYQLHNSAYPAYMCRLYWKYTSDKNYLRDILPVMEGVADFYAGISSFDTECGQYEIKFKPCMGQDELGEFNQNNYLCCVASANYSVKAAVEMYEAAGCESKPLWLDIVRKGYAFSKLIKDDILITYEGGPVLNPLQKHPSQLNVLAALPTPELYKTTAFLNTLKHRYDIARESYDNYWIGWSLGTFLIADVRMRDHNAVNKDFGMLNENSKASRPQVDKNYIQFYETGGYNNGGGYFITMSAMVMSAISQLFVQAYEDVCEVFPVLLDRTVSSPICFDDFLTPFGYTISGIYEKGVCEVTIKNEHCNKLNLRIHNCEGKYNLINENGNTIVSSKNGLFNIILEPNISYFIKKA